MMKSLLAAAVLALSASAVSAGGVDGYAKLSPTQIDNTIFNCECFMRAGSCIIDTRKPIFTTPVRYPSTPGVPARDIPPGIANTMTLAGVNMCKVARLELERDSTSNLSYDIRHRWQSVRTCPYPDPTSKAPPK